MKIKHPEGPLFNSYNLGGYLLWMLPEYLVFIDGRADLYGDEVIQEWMDISNGTDEGLRQLETRGIRLILLEAEHGIIAKMILTSMAASVRRSAGGYLSKESIDANELVFCIE